MRKDNMVGDRNNYVKKSVTVYRNQNSIVY
jgi:hypothetical protein